MKAEELAFKTQQLTQKLRRTPMPLADLIPHLQEMADELRRLAALEKEGNDDLTIAYLSGHSKGAADTKAKLEQAAEPVAWLYVGSYYGEELQEWDVEFENRLCDNLNEKYMGHPHKLPLYTHPAPRKPMTEEDVSKWQGDHDVVMSIKAYRSLLKLVGVERNHKIEE